MSLDNSAFCTIAQSSISVFSAEAGNCSAHSDTRQQDRSLLWNQKQANGAAKPFVSREDERS